MQINKLFDHTLLKADASQAAITQLLAEAKEHDFMSVCLNPFWVSYAAEQLKDSSVKVCTVVGFPLGATVSKVKAFETQQAIQDGADEIDMVINIGLVKSGDFNGVQADIAAVVAAAKGQALVKVIIEACLLTDAEKQQVCQLAEAAGADFVKTSTGFSTGGATAADVALMRGAVSDTVAVKASGGVKTYEDVLAMTEAGASRIGTSAGTAIMAGSSSTQDY